MTPPCPRPPETLTGLLALSLTDAQNLIEQTARERKALIFDLGEVRIAGEHATGFKRVLLVAIAHGALANVSLEAPAQARCAPGWTATLATAGLLQIAAWAGAWSTLYGRGTKANGWHEAANSFEARVDDALDATRPCRNGAFTSTDELCDWIAWARTTLVPIVERAETKTLTEMAFKAPKSDTRAAPNTVAQTLRVAIDDGRTLLARTADGTARYEFRSGCWQQPDLSPRAPCAVGAAGAVIARSLAAPPDETLEPWHFAPAWRATLRAINYIRTGAWIEAFEAMHGTPCHPGAKRFASHKPEPNGMASWEDADGYARWLDDAEHTLLPIIRVAEADVLRKR